MINSTSSTCTAAYDGGFVVDESENPLITQAKVHDLIRCLEFPKGKTSLLHCQLLQWNLWILTLQHLVFALSSRRLNPFKPGVGLGFCNDIVGLIYKLYLEYIQGDWWLFLDARKVS